MYIAILGYVADYGLTTVYNKVGEPLPENFVAVRILATGNDGQRVLQEAHAAILAAA